MTTTKRIRNVAFLGLLATLVWAGPVSLRADTDSTNSESGGWQCGYGDCQITWTECPGTWNYWSYPDGGTNGPGDCIVQYDPSGEACSVDNNVNTSATGSLYRWNRSLIGGDWWWTCSQDYPE
jgi:hypothetical protein